MKTIEKIFFLVAVAIISGCATAPRTPVSESTIGFFSLSEHNNDFCYLYKGVTIFTNTHSRFPIKPNFTKGYTEYLKKGITKSGNQYVYLGKLPVTDIETYFSRSEWDHSISLTNAGIEHFNSFTKNRDIDYVIIPWLYSKNECMVTKTMGVENKNNHLRSNIQLHLIKTGDYSFIASRHTNDINTTRPKYYPVHLDQISENEADFYMANFYHELEDDVYYLINGK